MPLRLRRAGAADSQAVATLLLASRRHFLPWAVSPHGAADCHRWVGNVLIPTEVVTLAVSEDAPGDGAAVGSQAVGFIASTVADGVGWITQLYLDPVQVGRGIGSILLGDALKSLPRTVRLHCFQRNQRACRFYERHGFVALRHGEGSDNEEGCPDVLYERAGGAWLASG